MAGGIPLGAGHMSSDGQADDARKHDEGCDELRPRQALACEEPGADLAWAPAALGLPAA